MYRKSNKYKTYNLLSFDINIEKIKNRPKNIISYIPSSSTKISFPIEIMFTIFDYLDPLLKLRMSILCKKLNSKYNKLEISDKVFNVNKYDHHEIICKKIKFNIIVMLKYIGYSFIIKKDKFGTFSVSNLYNEYFTFNIYNNLFNQYEKLLNLFEVRHKMIKKDYIIKLENGNYIINILNSKEYDLIINKIFKDNTFISIYKITFNIKENYEKKHKMYKCHEIKKYISKLYLYKPKKFVLYKLNANNIFVNQIKDYIDAYKYKNNYYYNDDYEYEIKYCINERERERRYRIQLGIEDPDIDYFEIY